MSLSQEEIERRKQKRKQDKYNKEHKMIDDVDHKICSIHDQYFPNELPWLPATPEFFYFSDKNSVDNLHPYCKRCEIIKNQTISKNIPNKMKKAMKKLRKTNSEYNKREQERLKTDKERSIQDTWRKNHPDKCCGYGKKHRGKDHVMYDIEWDNTKKYFDYKCAYCGLPLNEHWITRSKKKILGDFHKDHVIDDGRNDIKNCLPACNSCNTSKHTKTLNEFYNPSNPNYTRERYLKIVQWLRYDCKKYILPKRRYKRQRMKERLREVENAKSNKIQLA